jgi:hypothetical protein
MIGFDVIEVVDNVLLGNGFGGNIIKVSQQVTEFGAVISNSTGRIMFGGEDIRKFYK